VPRVLNGAIAVFLLACLSPAVTHLGGLSTWVQVVVVLVCLPVLLVVVLCAVSAARPGALGRAPRRSRARRRARTPQG
jgi:threonine/homoserine/homoserine lactone efflux protein